MGLQAGVEVRDVLPYVNNAADARLLLICLRLATGLCPPTPFQVVRSVWMYEATKKPPRDTPKPKHGRKKPLVYFDMENIGGYKGQS